MRNHLKIGGIMGKRVKTWPAVAGPGMGLEDPVFLNYKTKLLNEILS